MTDDAPTVRYRARNVDAVLDAPEAALREAFGGRVPEGFTVHVRDEAGGPPVAVVLEREHPELTRPGDVDALRPTGPRPAGVRYTLAWSAELLGPVPP